MDKEAKDLLTRVKSHFVLGDMRKWCIQYGCDTLEWELSNRSHILSHGLSNIEDKHYRHPLPEQIYDVYNRYWGGVEF